MSVALPRGLLPCPRPEATDPVPTSRPAASRCPMTVTTAPRRPVPVRPAATRAGDSQRVLHRLVRRELRQLAELSTWAAAGDPARAGALTRHADLLGRVLLGHHAVERELLWPALLRAVP